MVNLNKISTNIGNGTRKFVTGLSKGDALAPIILLEATVIAGRTYHAYERGGFVEGRERGTEEVLGAVFWLGGVQAFNKLGDLVGKRLLGLKSVDFEVGQDALRKPMKNFMAQTPKYGEKALAAFKFTKIITSILLANSVIGFVVPKLNQAITKKYQDSLKNADAERKSGVVKNTDGLDNFVKNSLEKDKKEQAGQPSNKPSFQGGVQTLLSLTNCFENDARYKLLSTDVGIAGGRAVNARNKQERREILFRDLSSVYFYMFCRTHINAFMNTIQDGKSTRLDPVSAKDLDTHLQSNLKGKDSYSVEDFERLVFGDKNVAIPKDVQSKIQNGIIKLDEFKQLNSVKNDKSLIERATLMSELQPKLAGDSILSAEQIKDVYSNGLIDDPKFLAESFKKFSNGKSTDPMQFFAEKDLRKLKTEMVDYVDGIIKKSKTSGESITMETLKKANKANFYKNAINLGAGFAVSAYFLSTAIPKIQYWMTRKQTGQDKFPGVETYSK